MAACIAMNTRFRGGDASGEEVFVVGETDSNNSMIIPASEGENRRKRTGMELNGPLFRRINPSESSDYGQIKWNNLSSGLRESQSPVPLASAAGWQYPSSATVDSVSHRISAPSRTPGLGLANSVLSGESNGQPFNGAYSNMPFFQNSNMERQVSDSCSQWNKWGSVVQPEVGLGCDGTGQQLSSLNAVQTMDEAAAAVWVDGMIKDLMMQSSPNVSMAQIIQSLQEIALYNPHIASVLEYRLRSLGQSELGLAGNTQIGRDQNVGMNVSSDGRGFKRSMDQSDHHRRDMNSQQQIMVDWKSIGANPDSARRSARASQLDDDENRLLDNIHGRGLDVDDQRLRRGNDDLRLRIQSTESHDIQREHQPDSALKLYLDSSGYDQTSWASSKDQFSETAFMANQSMWVQPRQPDNNSQPPVLSLQHQANEDDPLRVAPSNDNYITMNRRINTNSNQDPSGNQTPQQQGPSDITASDEEGLHLLALLLQCAEAVSADNFEEANTILPQITELSTPYGNSVQRVAAYFAEAMSARLVSSCIGMYSPLPPIHMSQSQKIVNAFQVFNGISPFVKFSHFTANQAIQEAFEREQRVHIIDLDIMQGLQWPGLFHILASRPGGPPHVRITGLGTSLEALEATGKRLSDFAHTLNLPFEFHPVADKVGKLDPERLKVNRGDALAVHWLHHSLYDVTGSDTNTLRLLQRLSPKVITVVEQDLSHGGSFLSRFVEAIHYYSALFDSLGASYPEDSHDRHLVEQQLLSREIKNILAVGGPARTGEVKFDNWRDQLKQTGFKPISLAGNAATQATLLLGMFPCQGYTLMEENGTLKLGWKGLCLLTASAWRPAHHGLIY